jgi:hypothetical protein
MVLVYMLQGRRLLEETPGAFCQHQTLTELLDWMNVAVVAFASVDTAKVILINAAVGQRARRGAHLHVLTRTLIAMALVLSAVKLAALTAFEGSCAFPQVIWCLIFISFGMSVHLVEAPSIQQAQGKAAVVNMEVIGADGDLESGSPVACSICLADWEPGDCLITTPCNHSFHEGCLRQWLLSSMCRLGAQAQSCAMCRRDLRCTGGLPDGGVLRGG